MMFLIAEMLVYLLVAAVIGFLAGWLIRGLSAARAVAAEAEAQWSARMTTSSAGHEAETLAAQAVIARLQADLYAAENRGAALEEGVAARQNEIENRLKMQARAAEADAYDRAQAYERLRATFEAAEAEWRGRLGSLQDELNRLTAAEAAAEAESGRLAALEGALRQRDAMIGDLREALEATEARLAATAAVPPRPEPATADESDSLRRRIARLEAELEQAAAPRRAARSRPVEDGDDLMALTGLGPVMSKALRAQGVNSWRALALMTPEAADALGARMGNAFADRWARENWAGQARALHVERYGAEP